MPSLRELQTSFAQGIFDDTATAVGAHIAAGRFAPERYLQIYRNNVFASLTQALKDVYPVVTRLVSDGFLSYAADAFIRLHPPRSGNLHDFGAEFADFLAGFAPARALAYLPDVARLEWAYHLAFHAADVEPRAAAALHAIAPTCYPELRFRLHPSAQLIDSRFPVLHIWEVNQPGVAGDETVNLEEGGVQVLIIRRDRRVELQAVSPGAYALLAAFAAGLSFETACRHALSAEAAFDISRYFQACVVDGTIVDIKTVAPPP